jgi:hypothetical protein
MRLDERERAAIIKAVGTVIRQQVEKLASVDEDLRRRIADLEAKVESIPAYAGVYVEGKTYKRGMLCTFDGGMWHAQETTTSKPATDSTWRLCVRRGRDAR